jgi:hypothetical protein
MEESIYGVLGWLIDPLEKTVTIYRPEREPVRFSQIRLKSPARDRGRDLRSNWIGSSLVEIGSERNALPKSRPSSSV